MMRNAFAGLASETEQLSIRQLLEVIAAGVMSVFEKMPRVDAADRLMISHAESNPTVSIATNQDIRNVAAVTGSVGGLTQIGGRDAAHLAYAMANAGSMHIYNNIIVS